jgi:hypothetical protein
MGRLIRGFLVVAFVCSCGTTAPVAVEVAPALTRGEALQLMETADEARAEALSGSNAATLVGIFRDPALKELRRRVQAMALRGFRLEEESAVRSLVSFNPSRSEGVLQVVASDRLVTPDQGDPEWSATARQVWWRLEYWRGRWWVADARDLSPDRWLSTS